MKNKNDVEVGKKQKIKNVELTDKEKFLKVKARFSELVIKKKISLKKEKEQLHHIEALYEKTPKEIQQYYRLSKKELAQL